MNWPSWGQIRRAVATDTAKTTVDAGGIWDAIVIWLWRKGFIPQTLAGRLATGLGLSVAATVADVNIRKDTVRGAIKSGLVTDLASAMLSRILRLPPNPPTPRPEPTITLTRVPGHNVYAPKQGRKL